MPAKLALAAALALALAAPAVAQPTGADPNTPETMKQAQVVAFIGLKPGDRVADIVGGRFLPALSKTVGPTGKVYAIETAEVVKAHPEIMGMMKGMTASPDFANVVVSADPVSTTPLPPKLDAVFIRQNYHDLHDKFMGPADVPGFNKAVYTALKPGGVYVVLDHAAEPGSGLRDTETRHRIDVAAVKSEVMAAGFKLDGESAILANPADDHTKNVFDPAVRAKTDQFLLRFRKPR